MEMREFTSETSKDGAKIVRISARISDHPNRAEQSEWIDFRIAIDEPTVRNGAILRIKALAKVRDKLDALATDLQRLVDQSR